MIALSWRPLEPAAVEAVVASPDCGALLCFVGTARRTRAFPDPARPDTSRSAPRPDPVLALEYEAFVPMALDEMARIRGEALAAWPGLRLAMIHRLGVVDLGQAAIVIAAATPHRAAAYDASRFCIEQFKARVPIWKRERAASGAAWTSNRP